MMRKCHLNTCPVGVATQDPVLRKRFTGQPEHVINYFFFVAEEVREIMAQLGYRTFNEMVGQTQMLDQSTLVAHWKAKGLDFSKLFVRQKALPGQKIYHAEKQNHHLEAVLDRRLIEKAKAAIDRGAPVKIEEEINNTDRSAGASSGDRSKPSAFQWLIAARVCRTSTRPTMSMKRRKPSSAMIWRASSATMNK